MARRSLWLLLAILGAVAAPPAWADEAPPADTSATALERDDEYYELYKVFADTLDQVERNYVEDISRRELMEAAIKGLLTKLDPYSNYIGPEEISQFKATIESEFGGIGIQIAIDNGQLKVLSPLVGSPAYRAGLLPGDWITQIEGEPTEGFNADDAVKRLKGEAGTSVTITVVRPGGEPRNVTLNREVIHVETVMGSRRNPDDSWNYILDEENMIGYIRVTSFARETAGKVRSALEELQTAGVRGLVLDLRFDPGGLLTSAIDICDQFISEGRIVSTAGRNSPERVWDAHAPGTFEGFPMAVLVNRYSASASEIVSACLQDHGRAVVIGERTWGKGSVQNVIELEGGRSALKLTTAGYLRPSGKNIHRQEGASESDEWGVMPNDGFALPLSDEEMAAFLEFRRQRDLTYGMLSIAGGAAGDLPRREDLEQPAAEAAPTAGFSDRQLQKAIEYLLAEAGKADAAKTGAAGN